MSTTFEQLEYLNGKTCLGCGCEPEVTGWYKRKGKIVGYVCSCGVMVLDDVVIGFSPPN